MNGCDCFDKENGACLKDYDGRTILSRTCKWLLARNICPKAIELHTLPDEAKGD